jgi:proteasome lid subunit RPN8/RPN11
MILSIEKSVYEAILRAARATAPLEACGLLGGLEARATEFYELTNADASGEHYRMLPEEQFAVVKDMRSKGIDMLAIWHSHPATSARMSGEDLRLAYTPNTIYVILSLADAETPDLRGFAVSDGSPEEIEIELLTEPLFSFGETDEILNNLGEGI